MPDYTWEDQRRAIQAEVNRFFRRRIDIAPRALASLQTGASADTVDDPDLDEGVFEYSVIESLLKSSPACSVFLFKAGANVETLEFPETTNRPAPLASGTLDWIFRGVDATRRVPTATQVRKKGVLEETDILVGALEASLRGTEPNEFGGCLLKAAGLEEPRGIRYGRQDPEWRRCDQYLRQITRAVKELAAADPSHSLLQFVLFEDERRTIRLRPFGTTGLARLALPSPLKDGQVYLYRGDLLQPLEAISCELSPEVLESFEGLLNSETTQERDFQRFFERYPLFLTGLDFRMAHPQPILYADEGKALVPDFFLERLAFGWDAILDLKRPYEDMVSRRPNRTYFKQHVQNAIAQLRFYREWFDNPQNRRLFAERYGVSTFRPKMVVVIGRRHHFRDDIERIRLIDGLPQNTDLWTYDDLYERAQRYLRFCAATRTRSGITKRST